MLTGNENPAKAVNLKQLAEYVRLTPGTVSAVLNNAPYSKSIPQSTRDRIFAAAEELNYKPNFFARSLRVKKGSRLISVLADELSDSHRATVIADIEQSLRQEEYFLVMGTHRQGAESLQRHCMALIQRGVEGFITINLDTLPSMMAPHVSISIQQGESLEGKPAAISSFYADRTDGKPEIAHSRVENVGRMAATKLLDRIALGENGSPQSAKLEERKNFMRYNGVSTDHRTVEHALTAKSSDRE
jgi:DNA-binding LacI/PurR family transcriptional regulator